MGAQGPGGGGGGGGGAGGGGPRGGGIYGKNEKARGENFKKFPPFLFSYFKNIPPPPAPPPPPPHGLYIDRCIILGSRLVDIAKLSVTYILYLAVKL